MHKHLLGGLVLSLVLILAVLGALLLDRSPTPQDADPLQRVLSEYGVQLDLAAEVDSIAELPGHTTILARSGSDRLRIAITTDLDPADAPTRVAEVLAVIDNLFGDRQAPYPGQLSNTLRCPDEYKPRSLPRGPWAEAVLGLYANDRLAFGGCSEDLLRYHATVGIFYDPGTRRLFQVEYFASLDDDEDRGPEVVASFSRTEGRP